MKGRARPYLVLAAACSATALAAPAHASERGCVDASPGSKEVAHSSVASVIQERNGRLYGCLFDTESLKKLPGQDAGLHIRKHGLHVAGKRAAYQSTRFTGDDNHKELFVYSARLWRKQAWAVGAERDEVDLNKLVLRSNGATAWIFTWRGNDTASPYSAIEALQHGSDGRPEQVEIASDEADGGGGNPIDATFLRLRPGDRSTVEWRRADGETRSFELR
jgi:hypothetical protein